MKEEWRFLTTEQKTAYSNMAIDRAVLVANSKGIVPPTIRFFSWNPPAISIGYFQSLEEEVNLDYCKKVGVDYVRRITGGGAVFHEKELTYSIVVPESHPHIPKNIIDSYKKISGAIIRGLSKLGIESNYFPINDILTNNKKISGNAQTRKSRTVLQHGTILMDVNVKKMFSILRVPNEKIKDKMIKDVRERVTSIKHVLGSDLSFSEVADPMKKGFEEEFGVQLVKGDLTDEELDLAESFERDCFSAEEWNYRR
jgi:lipoate-protein ligase A